MNSLIIYGFAILCHIVGLVQSEYQTYFLEDHCDGTKEFGYSRYSAMVIKASHDYWKFQNMRSMRDCTMTIKTTSHTFNGIIISVGNMNLNNQSSCQDYIKVNNLEDKRVLSTGLCTGGQVLYNTPPSKGIKIRFLRKNFIQHFTPQFEITLTQFDSSTPCLRDDHECKNVGGCIWGGFKCDGVDNCGDNSDEKCSRVSQIVGGVLGTIAVLGFGLGVFICLRRRRALNNRRTTHIIGVQPIAHPSQMYPQPPSTYYPQGPPHNYPQGPPQNYPQGPPPHYEQSQVPSYNFAPTYPQATAPSHSSK